MTYFHQQVRRRDGARDAAVSGKGGEEEGKETIWFNMENDNVHVTLNGPYWNPPRGRYSVSLRIEN